MKKPRLWVVELRESLRPYAWVPTVGAALDRLDAREELKEWRETSEAEYRIVPYERVEPPKRKKAGR